MMGNSFRCQNKPRKRGKIWNIRQRLEMNCIRRLKGNHAQRYPRMIGMISGKVRLDLVTQVLAGVLYKGDKKYQNNLNVNKQRSYYVIMSIMNRCCVFWAFLIQVLMTVSCYFETTVLSKDKFGLNVPLLSWATSNFFINFNLKIN